MLSPHTKPGTKVVCINAQDVESYLREGEVYTLYAITEPERALNMSTGVVELLHGVELVETAIPMPHTTFHPRRFRVAALPKCLTDLLIPEMV